MGSEHESLSWTQRPATLSHHFRAWYTGGVGGVSVGLSPRWEWGSAQVVPTGWSLGPFSSATTETGVFGQPGVGGSERLGSTTVAVGPMRRQSQGTAPNQVKLKVGIGLSVLENDFWCQVTPREEEAGAKCTHSLIQTCIPQVLAAKKAAFPECLTFFNLGVHLSFTCSPSSKSPFLA